MVMDKKGQEMSVTTLILIVIGVVLLVILILGISMGWGNLWNKINIISGGSGVESVIESCKIASVSDQLYAYCNEFKQVTVDGKKQYITCQSPLVIGLDKQLTCTGKPVDEKCLGILKSSVATVNKDDLYNGLNCMIVLGLADASGVSKKCTDVTPVVAGKPATWKAPIAATANAAAIPACLVTEKDITTLVDQTDAKLAANAVRSCCLPLS